jgi:hypothetical protein
MPSEQRPDNNGNQREWSPGGVISHWRPAGARKGVRVITVIQDKDGNRTKIADVVYRSED